MNIKKLKIFKNPNTKVRLCAFALSSIMFVTAFSSCSSDSDNVISDQAYIETTKKIFEPGQHIISIPVGDPSKEVMQYEYHEGYKCVGFGTSAYGKYGNSFGGACALYVNEYSVECYSSEKDENNMLVYNDFGTPLDFVKNDNISNGDTKDFGVGEHIISIPIGDPRNSNAQYDYYDGYEPVDIAISSYGKYGNNYGGGAIMYVNTAPVRCRVTSYDDNNKGYYLSFGIPIEQEKSKIKQ